MRIRQIGRSKWASWKSLIPTICTVFLVVAFLNARDATQAAFFGMAGLIAFAWSIRKAKYGRNMPADPGPVLFHLGNLTAVGAQRMTGWYLLAAIVFGMLGFVNLLMPENDSLPHRLGMALICFSILGAFLTLANESLRKLGGYIFSIGFISAGISFAVAAVVSIDSGEENANLQAVKQSVLSAFLLLSGFPGFWNLLFHRRPTPIYESGLLGPHGFVPWTAAERVELTETERGSQLEVGAYGGWTLYVDVPEDRRDDVRAFLQR
jgi:hypothetical protein